MVQPLSPSDVFPQFLSQPQTTQRAQALGAHQNTFFTLIKLKR